MSTSQTIVIVQTAKGKRDLLLLQLVEIERTVVEQYILSNIQLLLKNQKDIAYHYQEREWLGHSDSPSYSRFDFAVI